MNRQLVQAVGWLAIASGTLALWSVAAVEATISTYQQLVSNGPAISDSLPAALFRAARCVAVLWAAGLAMVLVASARTGVRPPPWLRRRLPMHAPRFGPRHAMAALIAGATWGWVTVGLAILVSRLAPQLAMPAFAVAHVPLAFVWAPLVLILRLLPMELGSAPPAVALTFAWMGGGLLALVMASSYGWRRGRSSP